MDWAASAAAQENQKVRLNAMRRHRRTGTNTACVVARNLAIFTAYVSLLSHVRRPVVVTAFIARRRQSRRLFSVIDPAVALAVGPGERYRSRRLVWKPDGKDFNKFRAEASERRRAMPAKDLH